jgi:hypothetical protein
LILKDQVIAVPFNSTHFDYNMDATGIQYGDLVEPTVSSVYTLRPNEGRFGVGVSVEQGTTNLWTGIINSYNNYATSGNMTHTLVPLTETYMGQTIYRLTMTPVSANALSHVQTTLSGHGVMGSTGFNYLSGNTYMTSIYWRPVNKSDISVGGTASNIAGWTDVGTQQLNNNWNRSVSKWFDTTNRTDGKYWSFKCPSAIANEPIIIDWTCPQIEQKTYPTSYVLGTRANGLLSYPKEVVNTDEGCISFWLYASTLGNSNGSSYPVFSSGIDNGCFDFLIDKTGGHYLRVYNTVGGANTQLQPTLTYDAWNHIVVYWKKNVEVGIYVNGVLNKNSVSPVDWSTNYNNNSTGFYVGSGIRSNPQIIVSDLKIDKKMPTAEDVSVWYMSNQPFYNPYDYRAFS